MVSYFLGLCSTFGADDLAEMMYVHEYSKPKSARALQNRSVQDVVREDRENMAQAKLQSWAISKVENLVDAEAAIMSGKETGFHMDRTHQSWEAIKSFSMKDFFNLAEQKGPALLWILTAAGIPIGQRAEACRRLHMEGELNTEAAGLAQTRPAGSGHNKRNALNVSCERHAISVK